MNQAPSYARPVRISSVGNDAQPRLPKPPILLILTILTACAIATAKEELLWTIGKPDHASLEFNSHWDFARGNPTFVIGQSVPETGWPDFQPGSDDQEHGMRTHPFTVVFDIGNHPRGVFDLDVDVMIKSPHIPEYYVQINGKQGRFYIRPQLSYDIGDPDTAWNIIYSTERLHISLPSSYFHAGANRLVLTCMGDESRVILPQATTRAEASGIYYDALSLWNDPAATAARRGFTAGAVPTIFYRRRQKLLCEVVRIDVATGQKFEGGRAKLRLAGSSYECGLPGNIDFGESECAVDIPELRSSARGRLIVTLGHKSRSFDVALTPKKKWKLYYVPQVHLDMGYTDYRPITYGVHDRNIDQIIETMESSPNFIFNPDGSFIYEDYWKHREREWQQRCVGMLKAGRLALPAQLFNVNTGLSSQEGLFRLLYQSAAFNREYGIAVLYANQTDVPAASWAFPSALAASGVNYLVMSSNPWRGPILLHGRLNEKSPFWWEGPDGSKVLTWFSRQYAQLTGLYSNQPEISAGVNSIPIFLQSYASPRYAADAVLVYGAQSDNRPFASFEATTPLKWNQQFAYPKIITSSIPDFFRYMERNFSSSFLTLKGDGGAWWEEMAAADAKYTARAEIAKQEVLSAETFSSVGAIAHPGFTFPIQLDRDIWNNLLLYTEHTWGAPRAWSHPDSAHARTLLRDKESFAERAQIGADRMLRRGLSQIADRIYTKGDTVIAFNPLPWTRSGLAEAEVPRGYGLLDLKTHEEIQLELVRRVEDENYDKVRFWVQDAPPLGYRCYTVTPDGSAQIPSKLPVSKSIENRFYRIVVDPARGGIASIYDRELQKELVNSSSPYALNEYLYAGYGHAGVSLIRQRTEFNSTLLQYSRALPKPELDVSPARRGKILAVEKMPWGMTLFMKSSAASTPSIETEIRLFRNEKKVVFVDTVDKEVVFAPEAAYFAFPFVGSSPAIRYEIQDAWVDPARDQLPGANKEWFSGQGWISVTEPGASVGVATDEAPLFTLEEINRGRWPVTMKFSNGSVFSYVMDNYDGDDERPYQGGVFTFHYALTSRPQFDPSALYRFRKEATNPLEVLQVTGMDKYGSPPEPLASAGAGFIKVSSDDVVLTAWKGAEDGHGYILRFYNTTDKPVAGAVITFPSLSFDRVVRSNAVEVTQGEIRSDGGRIVLSFKPHEIKTLRVIGFRLKQAKRL